MSKVKKNIRLCAISTDFSELGGYEKMVEHTARTGEWATWAKVMTSRLYIRGRFEALDAAAESFSGPETVSALPSDRRSPASAPHRRAARAWRGPRARRR